MSALFMLSSSHPCTAFFFGDAAATELYTLSLHDALPISTAFRPEKLAVPGRSRSGARDRVLAAAPRLDDGRTDSTCTRVLRFLSGRPRPVGPAVRRANSSAVQSACLTRRKSGVRIPLRPLGYQTAT